MKSTLKLSFPLLGKELVEQAARKRTYWVRVLYALLLFGFFTVMFADMTRSGNVRNLLGQGEMMFKFLMAMQFAGIYLFLPAMMAGVITSEKERESLALVLLTDIRPWELVLQKYVSRLVPMFSFLLLSLPPMAVAYSFGGLSTDQIASGVWMLAMTCLQVGALALMCSAYCQTTVAAFLGTYFLGALVMLAWPIIREIDSYTRDADFFLFGPAIFFEHRTEFPVTVAWSVPMMISTGVFLLMARVFVVRRAFATPKRRLRRMFRRLDELFTRWNRRLGGWTLTRQVDDLPEDAPVAWRETRRRLLGSARYLFRIFIVLEVPVLFLSYAFLSSSSYNSRNSPEQLSVMQAILWGLAAITLTAQGANLIASERLQQTLPVLLTTPMTAADIVRQKMRSLWRLMLVLAAPLLTVIGIEAWWRSQFRTVASVPYLFFSVLSVVLYLPLFCWVGTWVGLKVRGRASAILLALGVLVFWLAGPPLVGVLVDETVHISNDEQIAISLFSPATVVVLTEIEGWGNRLSGSETVLALGHFCVYGTMLVVIISRCLRRADYYLCRDK